MEQCGAEEEEAAARGDLEEGGPLPAGCSTSTSFRAVRWPQAGLASLTVRGSLKGGESWRANRGGGGGEAEVDDSRRDSMRMQRAHFSDSPEDLLGRHGGAGISRSSSR